MTRAPNSRTGIISANSQSSAVMGIYPYQTREVRDLAWACFGPPLLVTRALGVDGTGAANCMFPLTGRRRLWLETLDRDATPLLAHLSDPRRQRLGLYFESLWHFFLEQDDEVELLARNLPVHQDGRTIGEFDCLYFCRRRNCHVHLELAVKFYLGWPDGTGPREASKASEWLGPNARDRLDIKLDRLLQHQSQLGSRESARPLLESLGIEALQREIEIKGRLFAPLHGAMPPPVAFHPDQRLHSWLRLAELAHLPDYLLADAYRILPRLHWLSAERLYAGQAIASPGDLFAALQRAMTLSRRPMLIAALDSDGSERARFFVVNADWPDS